MNEQNNEIAVRNNGVANRFADEGFNVAVDMTSAQMQYCSMKADTAQEKAALYNAMNNPDKRLADCINMKINIKDLYIEIVNCTNEETGEVTPAPRVVILDDKGVSYQCVSVGIYSAMKKIVQIFGTVDTWEKPVTVEVKQINKNQRRMLTLNVVA